MNKKGFTIVELIVSFSLAATIGFFLLRITMVIKDLYTDSYVKTNIISKQNIITERMYDDFLYNDVKVGDLIKIDDRIAEFNMRKNEVFIDFFKYDFGNAIKGIDKKY